VFRSGYVEGYLDCVMFQKDVSGEVLAAVRSLVVRDDGGFAERFLAQRREQRLQARSVSRSEDKPTEAQRNADADREQGQPPAHEQHPLSEREQHLIDDAAAKQQP
jgi:hypothetical protein